MNILTEIGNGIGNLVEGTVTFLGKIADIIGDAFEKITDKIGELPPLVGLPVFFAFLLLAGWLFWYGFTFASWLVSAVIVHALNFIAWLFSIGGI